MKQGSFGFGLCCDTTIERLDASEILPTRPSGLEIKGCRGLASGMPSDVSRRC